jgi:hypothetical protein
MLPTRIPRASPRPVREFEVIAPDGRVFHFPRPSLPKRLLMFLQRHADTAAITAAILVLVYAAGLAAQALEGSAFDACELPRPDGAS